MKELMPGMGKGKQRSEVRTPRQRRERLKRCIRCDTPLHGGKGSNIGWYQLDGKWKASPMCRSCMGPKAVVTSRPGNPPP